MYNVTSNPLTHAVDLLKGFGFFDVFLPMLLIFVILYAILIKTQILGDREKAYVKAINAVISFVVSFLFITETKLVILLNSFLPRASLMLVITLFLLVFLAFTGLYNDQMFGTPAKWMWWIAIPLILVFLGVLSAAGFYIPGIHQLLVLFAGSPTLPAISSETLHIGIAVVLFIALPLTIILIVVFKGSD